MPIHCLVLCSRHSFIFFHRSSFILYNYLHAFEIGSRNSHSSRHNVCQNTLKIILSYIILAQNRSQYVCFWSSRVSWTSSCWIMRRFRASGPSTQRIDRERQIHAASDNDDAFQFVKYVDAVAGWWHGGALSYHCGLSTSCCATLSAWCGINATRIITVCFIRVLTDVNVSFTHPAVMCWILWEKNGWYIITKTEWAADWVLVN